MKQTKIQHTTWDTEILLNKNLKSIMQKIKKDKIVSKRKIQELKFWRKENSCFKTKRVV